MKDQATRDGIEKGDTEKAIKENGILLFLIPNQDYAGSVKKIVAAAANNGTKICFVSVNKPYEILSNDFAKNGIDTKKLYFIDCVTKNVKTEGAPKNTVFVSSPKALTEINIALKKMLEKEKNDVTIFDSLSTLLIYEDPHVVIRFVHSIISSFRTLNSKGLMIALKDDIQSELIKDLNMFVDKVVEMK